MYKAHLTLKSSNSKTGPIPTSVTTAATCPTRCALKNQGCYAQGGPVAIHWALVTQGSRGLGWDDFCGQVADLPDNALWRHNVAGDLPGDGVNIDTDALDLLVEANRGKRGFTYTHYEPTGSNRFAIWQANQRGFRINLSADNLQDADKLYDSEAGPVVVLLPHDATENVKTPRGRTVVVCPATQRDDVTCQTCELCQRPRTTIVGFPAHGSKWKVVDELAR